MRRRGLVAGALVALAGCASSPPPAPPVAPVVPLSWQSPVPWDTAKPADEREKGAWWRVFDDAELSRLIERAQQDSPTLAVLVARVQQAQAGTRFAEGAWLPRIDLGLRSTRQKTSANRPAATYGGQSVSTVQNDTLLGASVGYEVDLFDRIGSETAVAQASERQARSDLANARLLLVADLAAVYFALRQTDTEIAVVEQSLVSQDRAVLLLTTRHGRGAASGLDVAQQQALLASTRTQLALLRRQRALLAHTIATLSGQTAGGVTVPASAAWHTEPPPVPLSLPSEVLQRRPDIAAAQHAVQAANAQIGVARAGLFPSLVLGASGGVESRHWSALFDGPSLVWSLGVGIAQTLFDGGRNQARVDSARAAHEAVSANYRQTTLRALQEVEDGLSSLRALRDAAQSTQDAIDSAARAQDIAQARYDGGLVSYLEVVTAQQALLNSRRLAAQINGQQLGATVYLVKALGGGWQNEAIAGL